MGELDFIFNWGTWAHRGTWHVTDNLTIEEVPERIRESDIADEKSRKYYKGALKSRYIFPAHRIIKGDAICGQKDGIRSGGLSYSHKKSWEGDTYISVDRPNKEYFQKGLDNPPMPLCSRCEKKAGI